MKLDLAAVRRVNVMAAPLRAAPKSAAAGALVFPVTGARRRRTLSGAFELQRFAVSHGAVVAVGILTGTLETSGGFVTSLARVLRLPVHVIGTSCDILHLELGPSALDILGSRIDLGKSVIDLSATRRAPRRLLCEVAVLLDNPVGLARHLNEILSAIRR
jgi:hypothetical protein